MAMENNAVYVRVMSDGGRVVILFAEDVDGSKPAAISHWEIDPPQCMMIVEAMARSAFEADTSLKPVGDSAKAGMVEQYRMTLTQRVALMLGTLRQDKMKTDGEVAQAVVEVCLKEIF